MNILENVTLGEHYFETAVLLRESLFLNSVLTNVEIWYGLTREDIKKIRRLRYFPAEKNIRCTIYSC